jgi:nitroimidazol reductase NimA-like FMN-containing flavoprotein (pyridoxamine 5'-phosphate oxidase superfamily)
MPKRSQPMTKSEIDTFLHAQRVGLLSLSDGDSAYAIPLGYSYDGQDIVLTFRDGGRKQGYIEADKDVCFVVYWTPEGMTMENTTYKSVICDGKLKRITEAKEIEKAVRNAEKHMGLPAGTWDGLLENTLKDPASSFFWKVHITEVGGRAV